MMGVEISIEYGFIEVCVKCLKGVCIVIDMIMVMGMENLLMVVMFVDGEMVIENVVCELEVSDFVYLLVVMGVKIDGIGIDCFVI